MEKISKLIISIYTFLISRLAVHTCYAILSLAIGYKLTTIKFSQLDPVIGLLQNISAAVFTLAGIWIAYSYPQAIAAYTSPQKVTIIPSDETSRIEGLVLIVLKSAFVISALLIFHVLHLVALEAKIYQEHRYIFKFLGVSFICYLSILQLKAIFVLMVTNILFVNALQNKKTEKSADDDL